jgi:hypothetical protein
MHLSFHSRNRQDEPFVREPDYIKVDLELSYAEVTWTAAVLFFFGKASKYRPFLSNLN